jgi:predicted nucleotidyltransferase
MASPSKEEQVLRIILENSPLRHWHFEELVKSSGMTRAAANKWLGRYQKEGLIKRVKEKGKFPYFTCGSGNPAYTARKKMFLLNKIHESGLLQDIINDEEVQTAIIFGSAARGDWYKDSDIDLFVYGRPRKMDKQRYERKLRRDIEMHVFSTKKELKKIKTGLIKNVVDGYILKGSIQDFAGVKI